MKRALITGITGQDGSYLAEFLLKKGYEVHGMVRRAAIEDPEHRMSRIRDILHKLNIHSGSLESLSSVFKVIQNIKPDECYHLAAQSFVSYSFEDEFSTLLTNINGTHHVLTAIKELVPDCKLYFAASSEMFGNAQESPQNEKTPFYPRSAYGISKLTGYHLVRNFREAYNLFAAVGILFNHESPRRGFEFVTRKISSNVAKIKLGITTELVLGNLDAKRDWGHAKEYVNAMWMMMQSDTPDDYVIATGKSYSIQNFLEISFSHVGLNYKDYVRTEKKYYRPSEIHDLIGDCSKAKRKLGWNYNLSFDDLVIEMVENDLRHYKQQIK